MNLEWSAEQLALHNRLREHGGSPAPGQSGGGGASWQALAADQVMALPVPVEYGGLGHSALTCAFALEGLGYGCRDIGLLVSAGAHMWAVQHPIVKFGTPQQKATYLPGLASGTLTGAHAITETETGSDALAMEAVAVKDGTKYRLSGRKRFVTNAPLADVFLVYATLGQQFGFTGVTAFLVERDHPGLKVEAEYQKAGLRSCPWGQVVLDDCVVDESRMVGCREAGVEDLRLGDGMGADPAARSVAGCRRGAARRVCTTIPVPTAVPAPDRFLPVGVEPDRRPAGQAGIGS